jgi:TrmH family RNA methyltransferase
MTEITSLQNPRVKAAVRLRDGRHRQHERRIIVDGTREIDRALGAGVRPVEAFICEPLCLGETRSLVPRLEQCGAELIRVSKPVFEKLAFGSRAEGIVAVAETPSADLADLALPENPLVAVLEGIEKPGNVGAVLRSADAAGISAVVVADPRTDLYNPNAIRASLGTIFTMPVAEAPAAEVLDWLVGLDLNVYAARVDGSRAYTEVDFRPPAAIVLGSEAAGLSRVWHGDAVTPTRLPMLGTADSLNVSATAAVLFYEALRQRAGPPAAVSNYPGR